MFLSDYLDIESLQISENFFLSLFSRTFFILLQAIIFFEPLGELFLLINALCSSSSSSSYSAFSQMSLRRCLPLKVFVLAWCLCVCSVYCVCCMHYEQSAKNNGQAMSSSKASSTLCSCLAINTHDDDYDSLTPYFLGSARMGKKKKMYDLLSRKSKWEAF